MQKMRESYPTDILKNDDQFIWIAVENQQLILKSLADLNNKVTFNQVGLNEVHIKLEAAQKSILDLTDLVHDPAVDFIFPISSLTMLEEMANRVNEDPRYRGALVIFKQYGNQELRIIFFFPMTSSETSTSRFCGLGEGAKCRAAKNIYR